MESGDLQNPHQLLLRDIPTHIDLSVLILSASRQRPGERAGPASAAGIEGLSWPQSPDLVEPARMCERAALERKRQPAGQHTPEGPLPFPHERRLHRRDRRVAGDLRLEQPARRGCDRNAVEHRGRTTIRRTTIRRTTIRIVGRRQRRMGRSGVCAPDAPAAVCKPADGGVDRSGGIVSGDGQAARFGPDGQIQPGIRGRPDARKRSNPHQAAAQVEIDERRRGCLPVRAFESLTGSPRQSARGGDHQWQRQPCQPG